MAKYQEYRNPITGKVTTTGENPYKQVTTRYGNRAQGVRQAAAARKRLLELRQKSATPKPTAPAPAPTGNYVVDALADTAAYADQKRQEAADKAEVEAQKKRMDERRQQVNPETGKKYNPGFNLGLSENEIAFNKSVRNSIGGTRNRIEKLRGLLAGAGDNQANRIRNRIERQKTRRDNFRSQLFAPEGTNAPTLPKPPARPGMNRPKKPNGPSGGVRP